MDNEEYMTLALIEAKNAELKNEVPIGAIIVLEDKILSKKHNSVITNNDPSAHAEINAIKDACKKTGNYRLNGAVLYTTIEPCIMCAGAIINARIAKVVFGAQDPKWGAFGSLYSIHKDIRLNHQVEVVSGIMESECAVLMKEFFANRR
ncbi:MAG: tRNA adenosine(34) deaminase TadA [Pseudomonadota bacterium]